VLRWLSLAAAVFLGGVLLLAAWTKAIDPVAFEEQIRGEGLEGWLSARTIVFVALGLEFGLGLALLLGLRRVWVLVPAGLLILFFLFLTGRAYWYDARGIVRETASCGCFGHLVERSPAEAFWGDLVLLGVPYVLIWVGKGRAKASEKRLAPRPAAPRLVLVAIGTIAGLTLTWKAPVLPLDDLATQLKPGVRTASLCAGAPGSAERICLDALAPELDTGRHTVVLADLDGESFLAGLDALQQTALAAPEPNLWVLADATPEELHAFTWQWGPAFQIRLAPAALLRPLYRRLPRSFALEDGRVTATWAGLPPLATAGAG
jgi:uncharacterized membrane protein YphA (DoxX/SURF4 family)